MHAHQILFVEDDALITFASSDFLRDRGFRVIEAETASEAAAIINRRPYFSGLVTDINLGAGEDGFDVARRMRASYPGIAVIFVSGAASARHLAEGVEDSVFIHKPYHPREIADALRQLSSPSNLAA